MDSPRGSVLGWWYFVVYKLERSVEAFRAISTTMTNMYVLAALSSLMRALRFSLADFGAGASLLGYRHVISELVTEWT